MADPNVHHRAPGDPAPRRDRGLRRVSAATRWTVAAAAAGTAALGLTYTHLLPGTSPATAAGQGAQQSAAACVPQPSALAPTPAPVAAQVTHREKDDEGENAADAEDGRNTSTATAVQAPATVCLTPPAQPPAPGQQAPQTRTGAS